MCGRQEDIQSGRRAGAMGPPHHSRVPESADRPAGRERGRRAFGPGDGPGVTRPECQFLAGRPEQPHRADFVQGARRVRRRPTVFLLRRTPAVRPHSHDKRPRQRDRRVL